MKFIEALTYFLVVVIFIAVFLGLFGIFARQPVHKQANHAKKAVSVAKRGGEVILWTDKQIKERATLKSLYLTPPAKIAKLVPVVKKGVSKGELRKAYNDLFRY